MRDGKRCVVVTSDRLLAKSVSKMWPVHVKCASISHFTRKPTDSQTLSVLLTIPLKLLDRGHSFTVNEVSVT